MSEAYADTFYWLALLNPFDSHHEMVKQVPIPDRLVLTDAVRLEVMDAFCKRSRRPMAVTFWEETLYDPQVVIVTWSESLLVRSAEMYAHRMDKDWSLTDCISFIVGRSWPKDGLYE
jgi:predicted nucleic acid-binding protein